MTGGGPRNGQTGHGPGTGAPDRSPWARWPPSRRSARPGADRSPRPRQGDHGGGQHRGGARSPRCRSDVNRQVAKLRLPPGVTLSQGGEVEDQDDVFGKVFAALGLAVMLMYLILVVQFGSFLDPLAILLSLPLSLVGVVLMLLITGDTLNIMSLIGVILLMGIVAKNAILLIDFAKWNHEKGMPLRDALIEAGRVRLRPILMTTVALIAGMIPVALGARRGRRLPRAARPRGDRRHDHLDRCSPCW